MKKAKSKSKILFAVALLLILISTMVMPAFASQVGTGTISSYNSLTEAMPQSVQPAQLNNGESKYTLLIEADKILASEQAIQNPFQTTNTSIYIPYEGREKQIRLKIDAYDIEICEMDSTTIYTDTVNAGKVWAIPIKYAEIHQWVYEEACTIINNEQYTKGINQNTVSYNNGYSSGRSAGYTIGRAEGYTAGYNTGSNDTSNALNAGTSLITTTIETPINMFMNILNFEILGINVFGFISACITLMLVVTIIKKVSK